MVASVMESHPDPEAGKQPQTNTIPSPRLFPPDATRLQTAPEMSTFVTPQNIFPKVLEIVKMFLWQRWDECLYSLCSAAVFAFKLSHRCHLCPVSFLLLNHEYLTWDISDLQSRCCSLFFCAIVDESSMHSWSHFARPMLEPYSTEN